MYRIRKELFENPEIGLKENMASELLAAMFREEGFSVIKGIYGLETGFRAEYASGRPGPSIAFICEYDALPEIGHACGHNIIAAMSYGAACGLKSVLDDIGGRVVVFGTPDEERTSGKVNFVEAHAFPAPNPKRAAQHWGWERFNLNSEGFPPMQPCRRKTAEMLWMRW